MPVTREKLQSYNKKMPGYLRRIIVKLWAYRGVKASARNTKIHLDRRVQYRLQLAKLKSELRVLFSKAVKLSRKNPHNATTDASLLKRLRKMMK